MILLNAILFVLVAALGSSLALVLAWMFSRGRPAAVRHLVWTAAFAAMLALPVLALLLPSQLVWQVATAAPMAAADVADPVVATAPAASGIDIVDGVLALVALWLLGVFYHGAKALYGSLGLMVLYRRSVPHIPHGLDPAPFRGLKWQLRLRTRPSDAGPMTWGIVRPVVLLPKSSVTWPRERLMSVLLHEAAHVRRKDCLCRLIAVIASALYWPNPLVWLALREMRRDGECAADDAVLSAGVKASRYAEHLVSLARGSFVPFAALTLSMAERSMLEPRVKSILDPKLSRTGVSRMDVLKIAVVGVALTSSLALIRPSFASDAAPQTAAPAVQRPHKAAVHTETARHAVVRVETKDDGHGNKTTRQVRIVTQAEGEDLPDMPPVPPVPPVPPIPDAAPVPPVPPAPPVPDHASIRVEVSKALAAHKQDMKRAAADMKNARVEIKRALDSAELDREIAEAMKEVEADVARTRAQYGVASKQAQDAAKIRDVVMRSLQRVKPRIEKALAQVEVRFGADDPHQD